MVEKERELKHRRNMLIVKPHSLQQKIVRKFCNSQSVALCVVAMEYQSESLRALFLHKFNDSRLIFSYFPPLVVFSSCSRVERTRHIRITLRKNNKQHQRSEKISIHCEQQTFSLLCLGWDENLHRMRLKMKGKLHHSRKLSISCEFSSHCEFLWRRTTEKMGHAFVMDMLRCYVYLTRTV